MIHYSLPLKLVIIVLWAAFSFSVGALAVNDQTTQTGIALLLLFAGLWMTEIIPLPVSALLVPVLAVVTHIMDIKTAMAPFSSTIIYLFMGGFTLAALLSTHGLDRWLASRVTVLTGGRLWYTLIAFFAVTTFLSMWMSNTATTAMMLPIALGLVDGRFPRTRAFVVLGTAYAANIGGLATIIGSPPNAIAAAALDIDFGTWFGVGFPATLMMFPMVLLILWLVIRPEETAVVNHNRAGSDDDGPAMVWTAQARGTIALFIVTVICWVFARPIGEFLDIKAFDRLTAIIITAAAPALGLISWKNLERRISWGILLLFGGGLCLSAILQSTGASAWLAGDLLQFLAGQPGWVLVLAGIALMITLTEFASNTGSAAILIPVMVALADRFNPAITYSLVFGVGVAASCAFMLPVATPPNALAYGTGEVRQGQMLKAGILLNLIAVLIVYLAVSRLLLFV